jgi:hypothetical protein
LFFNKSLFSFFLKKELFILKMNVDDIVISLSQIVEFKEIDSIHDLYGCIKFCMEFVENFKKLNGQIKKKMLLTVLHLL